MPVETPPSTTPAMVAAAAPSARAARPADVVVALRPAATKRPRSELVSLSPRRLRPVGSRIRLPFSDPRGYAVAPDRRRVAVATQEAFGAGRNRITIVRRKRWTRSRTIELPTRLGSVTRLAWLRGDRVLVFSRAGESDLQVTVLDPLTGRRVGDARALTGFGGPRVAGDHVALFSSLDASREDGATAATALILDAQGQERGRVQLGDLTGPQTTDDTGEPPLPSYTVDPTSGHVLALAGSAPLIVDIDPVSATAVPHTFAPLTAQPVQQTWIEGAVDATHLALSVPDTDTGDSSKVVPVDRATLVPGTPAAVKGFGLPIGAGPLILVPSGSLSSSSLKGLRAVTPTGAPRWIAEPGHRSATALPIGRYLYADVQGVGSTVIAAATGTTVGRPRGVPVQLFDPTPTDDDVEGAWVGFGGPR